MTTRIKKYKSDLCFLGTCPQKQRGVYLKSAPAGLIQAVGDIAQTLLPGNLPLRDAQRKKLRMHKRVLMTLAGRKQSIQKKRKILISQRGGNLLGTIWSAIKSLLS